MVLRPVRSPGPHPPTLRSRHVGGETGRWGRDGYDEAPRVAAGEIPGAGRDFARMRHCSQRRCGNIIHHVHR